jgi:hypothetical protein
LAINFNGLSDPSQPASFYVCSSPSDFAKPEVIEQNRLEITIQWRPPQDDGGCSITSYVVYRNDGLGGPITEEVNEINDSLVRNLPSLN